MKGLAQLFLAVSLSPEIGDLDHQGAVDDLGAFGSHQPGIVVDNIEEEENISLNTYIVTPLAERHTEKKLLNKIEALSKLSKTTRSKELMASDNMLTTAYEIEESKKNTEVINKKTQGLIGLAEVIQITQR